MDNRKNFKKWFDANGDSTFIFDHNLTADSVVMDLGGYTSKWGEELVKRYNCNLFIIEPIKEFYDISKNKFLGNDKVKLLNVGISNVNENGVIYLNGDASSTNGVGEPIEVEYLTLDNVIDQFRTTKLASIDLVQINIEGDEYDVLDYILDRGLISLFNNVQVQFHDTVPNHKKRRDSIHSKFLKNNYKLKYNFPFVWECWTKI